MLSNAFFSRGVTSRVCVVKSLSTVLMEEANKAMEGANRKIRKGHRSFHSPHDKILYLSKLKVSVNNTIIQNNIYYILNNVFSTFLTMFTKKKKFPYELLKKVM